jgi:UDP-N-acetylglucosamine--N-acetylmuramyl-(pentapeptide) pyrophosphoryl-undecaprenol N-acetylglucosamine transferase
LSLRIIIAGGGTGGHIFPAIAIAQAVQRLRPGAEVLFVGAEGRMEMEKVPQEGYKIIGLDIAGFNRAHLWKNLSLPFKILKAGLQARKVLKDFRPQAVVGVGGYASFPVLNAAQSAGIPTIIQEQNSYAGKSNRILGKRAKAVCVAYDGMESAFPKEVIHLTGNPVRKSISGSLMTREEACAKLGLDASTKTVLVVGGSLGAKSVNEAVGAGLQEILETGAQLLWQTGKPYFETAKGQAADAGSAVHVRDFIREMEAGYVAADFVISRAGALAIAELCIAAKPVVFVPYPHAAEDHQTSNASALVAKGAALMVADSAAPADLIPTLKKLMEDAQLQEQMRAALTDLAIRDADERIARHVIALAEGDPIDNSVTPSYAHTA